MLRRDRCLLAECVTNTYDGDGRRVQKSDGTLYWVDDNFQPLSVGTTSGITRDYVFVAGHRIAFVVLSTGNPYYYLSDHLGSDTVVASGDGKSIQWEADFFPFGAQRTVITNLVDNPFQFTGYEYDSGTGYNYAVARYDAGRWGRFLSPDPYLGSIDITNPQSLNRYAYVLNNPVKFVDPLGLECIVGDDGSISDDLTGNECDHMSEGVDTYDIVDGGPLPQVPLDLSDLPGGIAGLLDIGGNGGIGMGGAATPSKNCQAGPLNLSQNIKVAKGLAGQFWSGLLNAGSPGGVASAGGAAGAYIGLVKTGWPWDPRQQLK